MSRDSAFVLRMTASRPGGGARLSSGKGQRQPIMIAPTWRLPRRLFRHNPDSKAAPVASGIG
jgi:hypothetical protein